MKKNVSIVFSALVAAMTFFSCGTQQTATQPAAAPVHRDSIVAVEPLKEVITIAEALDMYQNPDKAAAITKKYGYKLKANYEVYRLDRFSKMYYKNCALAKLLTADKYADYPKPMRKGVSRLPASRWICRGVRISTPTVSVPLPVTKTERACGYSEKVLFRFLRGVSDRAMNVCLTHLSIS